MADLDVLEDHVDSNTKDIEKVNKILYGNGEDGMLIQLDRLNQKAVVVTRLLWLVVSIMVVDLVNRLL